MILFSNIGEVSRVQWWTLWLLPSAHPEQTAEQREAWGKQLLGVLCFQPGPGQDAVTLQGVCSAPVQLLLLPDSSFIHKRFELHGWACATDPPHHSASPGRVGAAAAPPAQAGHSSCNNRVRAAAFGSRAVAALVLSLAKSLQPQMLS